MTCPRKIRTEGLQICVRCAWEFRARGPSRRGCPRRTAPKVVHDPYISKNSFAPHNARPLKGTFTQPVNSYLLGNIILRCGFPATARFSDTEDVTLRPSLAVCVRRSWRSAYLETHTPGCALAHDVDSCSVSNDAHRRDHMDFAQLVEPRIVANMDAIYRILKLFPVI